VPSDTLRNVLAFQGVGLLTPLPTANLEDHNFFDDRDCLFNVYARLITDSSICYLKTGRKSTYSEVRKNIVYFRRFHQSSAQNFLKKVVLLQLGWRLFCVPRAGELVAATVWHRQ
jgi:hypothetical protein